MVEINFINEYNSEYDEYSEIYFKLAEITMKSIGLDGNYEISVTYVDNAKIQEINRDYRFKNQVTDVISFESGIDDSYDDFIDLGDVFISVDQAIAQASEYQHSLFRELSFLFVHGLLHCLGYDHQNDEEAEEMFELQEVILKLYEKN